MIGRLNHVGVATPSIDDSLRFYRETLGVTAVTEKRALPEQGVSVAFVQLANTEIELIEPYGETSTLTAFLAKNPRGGQHHLCFEVDDIRAARDALQGRGLTVLGSGEPRIGAHGTPVLFFHPRTTDGLLIELMETRRTEARAAAPGLEGLMQLGPFTLIAGYLTVWWTVLFVVLPLGARSHHESGVDAPVGHEPGSPVTLNLKRKAITTTWVSAVVWVVLVAAAEVALRGWAVR